MYSYTFLFLYIHILFIYFIFIYSYIFSFLFIFHFIYFYFYLFFHFHIFLFFHFYVLLFFFIFYFYIFLYIFYLLKIFIKFIKILLTWKNKRNLSCVLHINISASSVFGRNTLWAFKEQGDKVPPKLLILLSRNVCQFAFIPRKYSSGFYLLGCRQEGPHWTAGKYIWHFCSTKCSWDRTVCHEYFSSLCITPQFYMPPTPHNLINEECRQTKHFTASNKLNPPSYLFAGSWNEFKSPFLLFSEYKVWKPVKYIAYCETVNSRNISALWNKHV
jgi:hypothetical protein